MSISNEFEHDGVRFVLSSHDDRDFITVSCIIDERTVWTRSYEVLDRAFERGLMFRHRWLVRDGVLFLETDGEHWRGATSHDQRLHRVDRRGIVRVASSS